MSQCICELMVPCAVASKGSQLYFPHRLHYKNAKMPFLVYLKKILIYIYFELNTFDICDFFLKARKSRENTLFLQLHHTFKPAVSLFILIGSCVCKVKIFASY